MVEWESNYLLITQSLGHTDHCELYYRPCIIKS
jgi:hypothetical protein